MVMTNPYQSYQQNSVLTASPGELTLMLYNGCLKFLHLAKKAVINKNMEEKNKNIIKAQNIIRELMITLNMDIPISKNFMSLYDFYYRHLVEANIKNDVRLIEEVEEFIEGFRDTWKEVVRINRQQTFSKNGLV
jgi:flagellar protein FliS